MSGRLRGFLLPGIFRLVLRTAHAVVFEGRAVDAAAGLLAAAAVDYQVTAGRCGASGGLVHDVDGYRSLRLLLYQTFHFYLIGLPGARRNYAAVIG